MRRPSFSFRPGSSVAPQWHFGFSRFADQVKDFSPLFQDLVEDWRKSEMEHFATEGVYGLGRQWQPLSPRYAEWKEEHYPGRPILVRTGDMRQAVLNPRVMISPTRLVLEVETRGNKEGEKALFHEVGAGHLPRRPIMAMPASQVQRWIKLWHGYLIYATRSPYASHLR